MTRFRFFRGAGGYLAAFLLPVGILLTTYALTGIAPFGPKTLLTIDMSNEYVDYFSYFKSLFGGGGSLFYSFGKTLGGNMTGLFAVYLASPFNLLLLLFPRERLDMGVLLLTLLKTGLCGVTFSVYLRRVFAGPTLPAVIFSVFYALMAYNIVYALNIMWLDGVMLLPLVALGIELLIARGRIALYLISLTLAIGTDFYIGYMIGIFSVLFFVYRLLLSSGLREEGGRFVRRMSLRFAGTAALAVGLSAPLFFPALISLRTSKEKIPGMAQSVHHAALYGNFPLQDLLHKFVLGAYSYRDAAVGLPNVYCGLLVVLLLFLYFWNRRVPVREKLYSAAFILILLLSFYSNALNLVWHGFNPPTWFPYRYSFVLCFLLIVLAYRAARNIGGVGARHVALVSAVFFVALAAMAFARYEDMTRLRLSLSAVFTAAYGVLLIELIRRHRGLAGAAAALLVPVVCAEFVFSSYEMMSSFQYGRQSDFRSYVRQTAAAVGRMTADDKGFYRTEKTFTRLNSHGDPTFNDSLMFGYNGLSHYSSTDDRPVNFLMQRLGYKDNVNWTWYCRGSTAAADSLLGVRYLLSRDDIRQPYVCVGSTEGIGLYRNPYVFPIAFLADEGIRSVSWDDPDPFELQNRILNAMEPQDAGAVLLSQDGVEIRLQNCTAQRKGDVTRYIRTVQGQEASIEFCYRSQNSGPQYAFFEAPNQRGADLSVNGSRLGTFFDVYDNGVLPLGSFPAGAEVTLHMTLLGNELDLDGGRFTCLDTGRLAQAAARFTQDGLQVDSFSNTRIRGHVQADSGQLLFASIPFDTGWTVRIDGHPASTFRLLGTLTGVAVPAGAHRVEFSYRPSGLVPGCAVCAVCLLVIGWIIYRRFRKKSEKR